MKLALLPLLALVPACGLGEFDVTQTIEPQTISGSPLGGVLPSSFFQVPVNVTIKSDIQRQTTGPLKSIEMTHLELDLTSPSTQDWSFVQSVTVKVSSTMSGSSLPANVTIATASNPGHTRTMTFTPVAGVNLVPYINEGAELTGDASGTAPPQDVTYDGSCIFHVVPL